MAADIIIYFPEALLLSGKKKKKSSPDFPRCLLMSDWPELGLMLIPEPITVISGQIFMIGLN